MKWCKMLVIVGISCILLAANLGLVTISAQGHPFPWKFGGYETIDTLHMKYWSAADSAFDNPQDFSRPGFRTEITELWFSKGSGSFRVDKYFEKTEVTCNQFKGVSWETITENGLEYVLHQRVIQTGTAKTQWLLANILSGGGTELCEYKVSRSPGVGIESVRSALNLLSVKPYLAYPDNEELAVAMLEMDQALNPDAYQARILEFKKTYDKAGRKTAEYETNHALVHFTAEGPIYIDLEWGMALEGYISRLTIPGQAPADLNPPVCLYKVLKLETGISQPGVFATEQ